MKIKLYLLAIVACLYAFSSCSSDSDEPTPPDPNPDGMIEVSFNVKDYFTSEIIDGNGTKSTLEEAGIKVLQYRVLDRTPDREASKKVFTLKNYQVNSGDMVIKDKLPAGNYWIFFVGSTTDIPLPDIKTTDADYFERARLVYLPNYVTQLFSASVSLDLNDSFTKVEKDITLERNVGKIEIVIEDAQNMPEEMAYLYPVVKSFYPNILRFSDSQQNIFPQTWGTLYSPNQADRNMSYIEMKPTGFEEGNVPRSEIIKNSQYTMTLYMLHNIEGAHWNGEFFGPGEFAYTDLYLYGTKDKVTVSPMGDSNFPYVFEHKVVPTGVNVVKNKITRLSGKLFENMTNDENGNFKISANKDWDGVNDDPYIK